MCGIAGMLAADGAVRHQAESLEAMLGRIRHRGPDDEGVWTASHGQVGLAHTRLSILDLTAGRPSADAVAGRPAHDHLQRRDLQLSGELRARSSSAARRSAPAPTPKSFWRRMQLDGTACFSALRGMFAFAIWDERDRSCLLARDRFGIKPLYYYAAAGRLTFASEVKALVASGVGAARRSIRRACSATFSPAPCPSRARCFAT